MSDDKFDPEFAETRHTRLHAEENKRRAERQAWARRVNPIAWGEWVAVTAAKIRRTQNRG
jgi:hypothetical protein